MPKSKFDLPLLTVKSGKEYVCLVKENRFIEVYSIIGRKCVFFKK